MPLEFKDPFLPKASPYFSVLIVNFNAGPYVQTALDSLAAQTFRDFEVILLDNASQDGSADRLDTAGLPAFQLLEQPENLGFAAGNNRAAEAASGTFLALLNPDAAAEPDWLKNVAAGIQRHPGTHSFACTQIASATPDLLDGAGDNYLLFGIPWRGGYHQPRARLPDEGECFSPCGASTIIRTETFRQHGGFDERLFCYCEDVDLAYRMRLAGQPTIFLPDAVVYHVGGGATDKISGFALFHGTRNRLWVYLKNTPASLLWWTLPVHAALTIIILLRGLITGRFTPTWKGLMAGISGLGPVLADRRAVQRKRTASTADLLRIMPANPLRILSQGTYVIALRENDQTNCQASRDDR